jgi:hypothetical protein
MDWREWFLIRFGPGFLGGIAFRDWLRLLSGRRFAIAPSRLPRALAITFQSLQNSLLGRRERRRFGPDLERTTVEPPLFVLGHWRSGTTHLHNLLTVDRRFAFPNIYQSCYPHTFLTTEARSARWVGRFIPRRRPMDNVAWDMTTPQEEEFALCISSLKSPYLSWVFPAHRERFDRYLTFRGAAESEVEAWLGALDQFLGKLTWKYRRPLILKSPPHTCRIRLLLRKFPEAKFVHIHREPFTVFQSSRWTFLVNFRWHGLERPRLDDLDDWVIRQYREMYEVFFEERKLIPPGRYCEVKFEDLEKDPLAVVRSVYQSLALPDFEEVEPELKRYVASLAGYRKNAFPDLQADLRRRISTEWRACFEEWGYPA